MQARQSAEISGFTSRLNSSETSRRVVKNYMLSETSRGVVKKLHIEITLGSEQKAQELDIDSLCIAQYAGYAGQ